MIGPGSPPLCAVQAVVSFLECWSNRPGPLFLFENGLPLSGSLLTDRLRAIVLSAGLCGDFSSHSFQIGAATSAARAGIPDHLIQVIAHNNGSPGAPLTYFNDEGVRQRLIFHTQKIPNFRICLPKRIPPFFSIPQKNPSVFLHQQILLFIFWKAKTCQLQLWFWSKTKL